MDDPGLRLKKRREELNLRYRDVEEASLKIARRWNNDEFAIVLSRLADIENKKTVPSIFRLYTLCTIYRLDFQEVLTWYGVELSRIPGDAAQIEIGRTHVIGFQTNGFGEVQVPLSLDPGVELNRTTYLSRMIQRWGKLPLMLLDALDLRDHRYAYIGTDDWRMYPLLMPGALVLIDETRRKVEMAGGWISEFERPIYLLEHREGYLIGWCTLVDNQLTVLGHPTSDAAPEVYRYPEEIEVVGQVVGVAMRLDQAKRRRTRP